MFSKGNFGVSKDGRMRYDARFSFFFFVFYVLIKGLCFRNHIGCIGQKLRQPSGDAAMLVPTTSVSMYLGRT